jgi:uncharacterized ferritin-like protein (DUF455 family)
MTKLELYDGTKTYMAPSGTMYDKARLTQDFPSALVFLHLIHTDEGGEVCFGVYNYKAFCSQHGLDPKDPPETNVPLLEEIMNAPPSKPEPSPEERIAAALEYQNLTGMEDEE